MYNFIHHFFLLFVLIVLISGCGKGAEKKNGKITVAVIPMGTTHEFWKAIHAGAVTAARELGVKVIWKGPLKEDDRDEQIQIVENFISGRISALVISPLDDRALIMPVVEAGKLGIPAVILDSELQENVYSSFVATDNYKGGVLAAEHIGKLMNGKGKLILIRVKEGITSPTKRENGFFNHDKNKVPKY
jgi:ribose transport system substrate-binding protein